MKKIVPLVGLSAVCLGLGLGLGLNIPTAQAEAGLWGCYVVDRLPDVKAAMWLSSLSDRPLPKNNCAMQPRSAAQVSC